MQQSTKGWSIYFHTPMIFLSSATVHKMMVHLFVTHQWFFRVVQQSTKYGLFTCHTQWLILVVQQSAKWLSIYFHTPMIYPFSAAFQQMMVHLLATHQWYILVVQQSTTWCPITFIQVVQQSTKSLVIYFHTPMIFPSSATVTKWWFIYLSHTT